MKFNTNYQYGFTTNIENDTIPVGLTTDIIKLISKRKKEPDWLLEFRLKSFYYFQKQLEPNWANLNYQKIDYQKISYFSSPKKSKYQSLDEVDPEILATFEKLGIPIEERKILAGVAVDAVLDSVSIKTTFQKELQNLGIIFCPISEAVINFPDLVKQYLGSVVPFSDNFFASLNSAVFSDGTFVYIPKNTICPMELSTYFRINAMGTGQFERTLIICEDGSEVSYLEGCTAPIRDENQLHAAVVELIALDNSNIKYSTVQNWYPGDKNGKGGIYNFVTKRGVCKGKNAKISWTQVETGSAITWKYPSVILKGENSSGEFYSVAITNNKQQADTGTKMIHIGKNTKSKIISKGISLGESKNTYRGLVQINKNATNSKNFTKCDSLILSDKSSAFAFPKIENKSYSSTVEHEASTSNFNEKQLFYLQTRGLNLHQAEQLLVAGFTKDIIQNLPMEFAVEAKKLLEISMDL
jgi:Fe-S cluster assembly protein SufB